MRAKKQTFVRVIAKDYDVTEDFAKLLIQDALEVGLYESGMTIDSDIEDVLFGLYLNGCEYANIKGEQYRIDINKDLSITLTKSL